jgi:hypothetical protein
MTDIEQYTSDELIKELMSRHTFAGIIISSAREVKRPGDYPDWNIAFRNLSAEQVQSILFAIAQQISAKSE